MIEIVACSILAVLAVFACVESVAHIKWYRAKTNVLEGLIDALWRK